MPRDNKTSAAAAASSSRSSDERRRQPERPGAGGRAAHQQPLLAATLPIVTAARARSAWARSPTELEQQAIGFAGQLRATHPDVERWAMPLLRRNTAQPLDRRFADPQAAIALLDRNLEHPETLTPLTHETDTIALARLHFVRAEYAPAIELLAKLYESGRPASLDS